MIDIDSISLALRLVNAVGKELPEERRPAGETRNRMIARIGAALEANGLALKDRTLLDLELRALKAASEVVRQVFKEEVGYSPSEEILPAVFESRSHLPELAAEFGRPIPQRETPAPEAMALHDNLIENPDVSRRYEREAIIIPEYPFDATQPKHIVAVEGGDDRDKFAKLDAALERSRFFEHLEGEWKNSGKPREKFRVIIKTHLAPMMARDEVGIYVDPTLVLHLVSRLIEAGYSDVAVAEGRNSFGNWFSHRGVCRIAARAGYVDEDAVRLEGPSPRNITGNVLAGNKPAPFSIVDLGLNTADYDFRDAVLGRHPVNREWMEADYRVCFSKLKTHFYARCALHFVNLSLALAMEDMIFYYPRHADAARAVCALVKSFPVHFSIIDGITGADRLLGYTHRAAARRPGVIIAGQDLLATASLTAQMIGIDPFESVYIREGASQMGGLTPYKVVGRPELVSPWVNVRSFWVTLATRVVERMPSFSNFWVPLFVGKGDPFFPAKSGEKEDFRREILRILTGARILLFFLTLDRITVRLRAWRQLRNLKKAGAKNDPPIQDVEFFNNIRRLNKDEMRRLRQILDTHEEALRSGSVSVKRYGHIIRIGEKNYPFLGGDALGAICAGNILKGLVDKKWTSDQVIPSIEDIIKRL